MCWSKIHRDQCCMSKQIAHPELHFTMKFQSSSSEQCVLAHIGDSRLVFWMLQSLIYPSEWLVYKTDDFHRAKSSSTPKSLNRYDTHIYFLCIYKRHGKLVKPIEFTEVHCTLVLLHIQPLTSLILTIISLIHIGNMSHNEGLASPQKKANEQSHQTTSYWLQHAVFWMCGLFVRHFL